MDTQGLNWWFFLNLSYGWSGLQLEVESFVDSSGLDIHKAILTHV